MNHIMIDIETLGTRSNSVILSIGVIEFDSSSITNGFEAVIDIDSCLQHGLIVEGGTIQWWMKQSDAARDIFRQNGEALPDALKRLTQHINWQDSLVWANGTDFDISILSNAYHKCSMPTPWEYNAVRDYRTIVKTMPVNKVQPTIAHSALADAIAQAQTLQTLWTNLNMQKGKAA